MARKDGVKIKGVDGFSRMGCQIVGKTRVESTNLYTQLIKTKAMDEFIEEKKKEGIEYTYRDIAIAALVRVFYLRPRFNRFVVAGNFYQRKNIDVAIVMHKNLRTGEKETVVKCRFTGKETLAEIKKQLDETLHTAIYGTNDTDEFVDGILGKVPTWVLRLFMSWLRFADRWGLLSEKFMYDISPFHASMVFGDMKSVHLGPVWHHLYNFGNCGFFATMGKDEYKALVDPKTLEIRAEKVVELGISEDERFVDGLTYSHMIKTINRMMENISVLERAPEDDEIKLPHERTWTNRAEKKKIKAKIRAEKEKNKK